MSSATAPSPAAVIRSPRDGHELPLVPSRRRAASPWSGLLGFAGIVERSREPATRTSEENLEFVQPYDLTGGLRPDAAPSSGLTGLW